MKKMISFVAAFLLLVGVVSAYTIDGDLSDWGVDPFSDGTYHASDFVPADPDIDYIEDDWPAGPGSMPIGGEPFDLEALYFDDFGGYAYFAIVTSLGSSGVSGYYMNALALDLDNDPEWGDQGYEYGIKLRGADAGKVCYLPVWTAAFADRDPEADFTCDGSDSVWTGTADLVYTLFKAGADNSHNTYVVEIEANKGLLGTPQFQDISDWHITQTCGNDILELNGFDWDYLPEFTTVGAALALLGAAGYVAYRKKKN